MSELIVGRNPVIETLRSGTRKIKKILIVQENKHPRLQQIIDAADQRGIPYQRCLRHELDKQHQNHQGVIAIVNKFRYTDFQTLLKNIKNKTDAPAVLIMLDQVQDPMNLGAILRTANATDSDGVLIPKNNSVDITVAVHKAAAGSTEHTPITKVTNLVQTMEKLKSVGMWVVGTAEDAELTYTEADFTVPLCIVLGNEGKGIRRLVKQKCDYLVHLPMLGQIRSLNVSVTAGVVLYEVLRQRNA